MKFSSFSTSLKEAFTNIIKNRLMAVATIITLSAGIFLFGITSAITLNVFSVTEKLQTDFKLQVYIDEGFDMNGRGQLEKKIKSVSNIESIRFVSKEEAFVSFKKKFPEPELLDGINDGSILRNSYEITLSDLAYSKDTVSKLEKIQGIAKVTQLADEMQAFLAIVKNVQLATVIISIILGLLSILIITNTINMSIFSRRKQINIMKYVGATDRFIKIPFLMEGFLIGIISSAVSYVGVYYLYNAAIGLVGNSAANIGFLNTSTAAVPLLIIVAGEGIFLGCLGSLLSIRKHLRV